MQFDVPVVIGGAKRLHDRFKFEFFTQDIIWPAEWKKQDDPMAPVTSPSATLPRGKCDSHRAVTIFVVASKMEDPAEGGRGGAIRLESPLRNVTVLVNDQ